MEKDKEKRSKSLFEKSGLVSGESVKRSISHAHGVQSLGYRLLRRLGFSRRLRSGGHFAH